MVTIESDKNAYKTTDTSGDTEVGASELREVCELTVKLTEQRQNECKHLCIENFAPDLFARLLYELSMHKKGMIRAEWVKEPLT